MYKLHCARKTDPILQVPVLNFLVLLLSSASAKLYDDVAAPKPLQQVVLEGEQTSLPCPIDMMSREPLSAYWYRVATGSFLTKYTHHDALKVYSLVAPPSPPVVLMARTSLFDGQHWKQHEWKRRAFFSLLSDPPALLLNRLERADTGKYVCNVTYHAENTENTTSSSVTITVAIVELFVAVPQPPPVLTDYRGIVSNATTGPYTEEDIVRLTCVVPAVSHKVMLVWKHGAQMLNSSLGTVETPSGGWATTVELGPLRREHLFWNISCSATSDFSIPIESWVLLDMFLAPSDISLWSWPYSEGETSGWVMAAPVSGEVAGTSAGIPSPSPPRPKGPVNSTGIHGPASSLSTLAAERDDVGGRYVPRSFECEVFGSRPHSTVTWFLDQQPLDGRLSHTRDVDNVTKSVLLLPAQEHAGKVLECRATNSHLPRGRREFSRYLAIDLSEKPEVSLKLGAGLNASHITEGTDVYMECSVLAPSRMDDVTWLHDHRELKAAPSEGILITSRYLVMRQVNPSQSGSYSCRVNRVTGESVESSAFYLRVKYSPICHPDEQQMLLVERNMIVNVTCGVKADPNDGLRYSWLLENKTDVPGTSKQGQEDTRLKQTSKPLVTLSSYLEVVTNASLFDTVLACWAENAVGRQKRPCRLTFMHKGEHSSGLTCTVGNYTDTSFSLLCSTPTGKNGTDPEREPRQPLVEVFDAGLQNMSGGNFRGPDLGTPIFVTGLRPSTDYMVVVRLPPNASFRTYVRTLGLAQTLKGRDAMLLMKVAPHVVPHVADLTRSMQPGQWNTTLSIVVVACGVAAALAALLGIYLVHAFKERWKTRLPSSDCSSTAKARDADASYIRHQKFYVDAAECC